MRKIILTFILISAILGAVAYFFLSAPSDSSTGVADNRPNMTSSKGDSAERVEVSKDLGEGRALNNEDVASDMNTITNKPISKVEVIKAKKSKDVKHDEAANSIVSAILDTLSAEIVDTNLESNSISAGIKWTSNIQILNDSISSSFDYKKNTSVRTNDYPNILISIAMPDNDGTELDTFKALTDSKISLIMTAGKYEEKITIASAQKDESGKVKYLLMPSKDAFHKELFSKSETMPITINDIPNDEIKLIRDVTLSIALERLDTGRTFRTTLDKKGL